MKHTTNYRDTLIQVSPDSSAIHSRVPEKTGTVAELHHRMMSGRPYGLTSDDVVFGVYAERNGIAPADWEEARKTFFSKGQPCLRSSPLVKTYGWGIHCDSRSRIALVGMEDARYKALSESASVTVVRGMRSSRK